MLSTMAMITNWMSQTLPSLVGLNTTRLSAASGGTLDRSTGVSAPALSPRGPSSLLPPLRSKPRAGPAVRHRMGSPWEGGLEGPGSRAHHPPYSQATPPAAAATRTLAFQDDASCARSPGGALGHLLWWWWEGFKSPESSSTNIRKSCFAKLRKLKLGTWGLSQGHSASKGWSAA